MIKDPSIIAEAELLLDQFYPLVMLVNYQWNWWNFIRLNLNKGCDFLYYSELRWQMYDLGKERFEQ